MIQETIQEKGCAMMMRFKDVSIRSKVLFIVCMALFFQALIALTGLNYLSKSIQNLEAIVDREVESVKIGTNISAVFRELIISEKNLILSKSEGEKSRHKNAFEENDIIVMETLADQVAIAIHNANLHTEVQEELIERTRIESALRESEEKFRNIVEASPMGMHMYQLEADQQLIFIDANPAANQILGVDCQQFVGKTIEEAFPALVQTEVPEKYRLAATTGQQWETDWYSVLMDFVKDVADNQFDPKHEKLTLFKDPYLKQAIMLIRHLRKTTADAGIGMFLDMHRGNIMLRRLPTGPQLVFTDPVAG